MHEESKVDKSEDLGSYACACRLTSRPFNTVLPGTQYNSKHFTNSLCCTLVQPAASRGNTGKIESGKLQNTREENIMITTMIRNDSILSFPSFYTNLSTLHSIFS